MRRRQQPFPLGIPRRFYPPATRQGYAGLAGESHRSNDPWSITPQGTPQHGFDAYDEREAWGTGGLPGALTPPPLVGGGPGLQVPAGITTVPFGVILGADGKPILWKNPTTVANFPILATTAVNPPPVANTPVLSLNYARNLLIIQNNSTATTAGDVAPTLFVGFNAQPQLGFNLGLPPGVGITFDIICPRDSVYIAWGTFSNAGASVVIQGVVVQGTYSP